LIRFVFKLILQGDSFNGKRSLCWKLLTYLFENIFLLNFKSFKSNFYLRKRFTVLTSTIEQQIKYCCRIGHEKKNLRYSNDKKCTRLAFALDEKVLDYKLPFIIFKFFLTLFLNIFGEFNLKMEYIRIFYAFLLHLHYFIIWEVLIMYTYMVTLVM